MKRDTNELAAGIPAPRKRRGFCAIYVIGTRDSREPVMIGHALDPKQRAREARLIRPDAELLALWWAPDRTSAGRLTRHAKSLLQKAGRDRDRGWFAVTTEWAEKVIRHAAESKQVPVYTNAELHGVLDGLPGKNRIVRPDRRLTRTSMSERLEHAQWMELRRPARQKGSAR